MDIGVSSCAEHGAIALTASIAKVALKTSGSMTPSAALPPLSMPISGTHDDGEDAEVDVAHDAEDT